MADKITMPTSGAGITRYFDESKSKIKIKPETVILFALLISLCVLIVGIIW